MATRLACPTIPGYTTVHALGAGQYGDVFLVEHTGDGRVFAAKVPRGSSGGDTQEARLLQRLQHPNVIGCYDVVRVDGGDVIVMEYAANGDLEGYIQGFAQRNVVIPEDEVMRIFIQIALALVYLHGERILHRDLKPKNVLLDAAGIVKLSDFGVSRSLQHTLDAAQTITGTPHYMSPELMDNQPYDSKTDVWSLGCILYELTTLSPPFPAKAFAPLVMQIVSQEPPPIPSSYSRHLDELARGMLTKDPSRRLSISEVIAMPFVQHHLFRLASTAPMPPVMSPSQLPIRPSQPTPLQLPSKADDIDVRRKMFFENQAAGQRNKIRTTLEIAGPSVYLQHDAPAVVAPLLRNAPAELIVKDDIEAARERTKQFYFENARAARLNKQRALEAMKGQAESILRGDPGVVEAIRDVAMLAPPPPPTVRNNKAYEEQLEEERQRVRAERKLLHERMRGQRASAAFSDGVPNVESPSGKI